MNINFRALFQRVLSMLIAPRPTWREIRNESDRGQKLITHYVLLLALIPVCCGFLGNLVFEQRFSFGDRFVFAALSAILKLAIFVASLYLMGFLVNSAAPFFRTAQPGEISLKLMAYVSTPIWVAGFITLIPQLTGLAIIAGYGYATYQFYLGCQELLGTPSQSALAFALTSVITWFVITLVTVWLFVHMVGLMFTSTLLIDQLTPSQTPLFF